MGPKRKKYIPLSRLTLLNTYNVDFLVIINKGKVEEKEGRREGGKEREGEIQNSKLIVVVVVVLTL